MADYKLDTNYKIETSTNKITSLGRIRMLPSTEVTDEFTPFGQVLVVGYTDFTVICKVLHNDKDTFHLPFDYVPKWKPPCNKKKS